MKNLLRKHLKIYENELDIFLWLSLVFLIAFFITAIFRNYVETAFLKRYGPEALPLMFVINGLLTIAFFKALDYIGPKGEDRRLLAGILIVYGVVIFGLFFMVKGANRIAYPILFQLLYLLDSFLIVYLWNVANSLVNTRQANRMYPIITAVMVAGATIGSFLTESLAALIGRDSLLLLSAVIFVLLALFLILGTGRLAFHSTGGANKPLKVKPSDYPGLIGKYPILRYLIIISLIPNILLPIFFYQFSVIANDTFETERALLTFLSFFRGGMTASIFIILLFVSKLYSKMGLVRVSLIFPANFALVFIGLFLFFNIHVAAAGQFLIRLIQRAIAGPTNKIFFLLVPREISAWSQVFVRGTVVKAGMLAGSLIMLMLKPIVDPRQLALPAAGLAIYLVIETLFFGRRYRKSLKQSILGKNIDYDSIGRSEYPPTSTTLTEAHPIPAAFAETDAADEAKEDASVPVETAFEMLKDADPAARALAAGSFVNTGFLRAAMPLMKLLNDKDIVRKAALDSLSTYPEDILPELESALNRLSLRGQGGVLEVIRLAGMTNFDTAPYMGRLLTEAYHNLMAQSVLKNLPGSNGGRLLIEHLEHKNTLLLELVFQALWVKYADMRLIYQALKSREAPVAVEMLEYCVDGAEAKYLIPLIDALPLDEKLDRGRMVLPLTKEMTLERCVNYLALSDDPATRMLTAFFLSEVDDATFWITIEEFLEDTEKAVRDTAGYALKRKKGEDAAMPEILDNMLFLKKCLVFDGLGARELKAVASIARRQSYAGDEIIIERGVEESSLHLIFQGRVNRLGFDGDGKQRIVKTMGPGGFFGLTRLFSGGLADETFVTAEPASILIVHRHHFEEIMKIYPQLGVNLCTFFALRLESLQARMGGDLL